VCYGVMCFASDRHDRVSRDLFKVFSPGANRIVFGLEARKANIQYQVRPSYFASTVSARTSRS
jgi:hypothetical protein